MSSVLTGLNISGIMTQTNDIFSAISPFVEFLAGFLLAFLVLRYIISIIAKKKMNDDSDTLSTDDDDYDDIDDDDY